MKTPKVSVIIAAYNCDEFIGDAIESIINQTFENWELIICDDFSTDKTFTIINQYAKIDSRINVLRNEKNLKSAATRNRCIEEATGEYIAIQDADDLSDKNRLRLQVEFLEANKQISFVGSGCVSFDNEGVWAESIPKELPVIRDFLNSFPFIHASIMFRKEALLLVEGYRVSKETVRGQDADMIMRMYAKGLQGANLQKKLYSYRETKDTYSKRNMKYRIDAAKIRYIRFKEMGLMPSGYFFMWKPIIVGLIPNNLLMILRKFRS